MSKSICIVGILSFASFCWAAENYSNENFESTPISSPESKPRQTQFNVVPMVEFSSSELRKINSTLNGFIRFLGPLDPKGEIEVRVERPQTLAEMRNEYMGDGVVGKLYYWYTGNENVDTPTITHELGHYLIEYLRERYAGYGEAERLFKNRFNDIGSKERAAERLQISELDELYADLIAVLYTRDLSSISKALETIHPEGNFEGRNFDSSMTVSHGGESHVFYSKTRQYLGRLIKSSKLGNSDVARRKMLQDVSNVIFNHIVSRHKSGRFTSEAKAANDALIGELKLVLEK